MPWSAWGTNGLRPEHVVIPSPTAATRGGRYWDPLATLSFVAASTQTIGLLTHVLVLGYHHPLEVVKRYGTLDVASGGRVILGVGVGSLEPEFELLDVPFAGRGARADDALRAIRRRSPNGAELLGNAVRVLGLRGRAQWDPEARADLGGPHPSIAAARRRARRRVDPLRAAARRPQCHVGATTTRRRPGITEGAASTSCSPPSLLWTRWVTPMPPPRPCGRITPSAPPVLAAISPRLALALHRTARGHGRGGGGAGGRVRNAASRGDPVADHGRGRYARLLTIARPRSRTACHV